MAKKATPYSESKHKRDAKGRFSKTAGQKVSATKYLKLGKAIRRLVDEVEEQKSIQEARRQIRESISKSQRKRLLAFIGTQKLKESTHKSDIKKQLDAAVREASSSTASKVKAGSKKRRVTLVKGQLEVATVPQHETFKVYEDAKHDYQVPTKNGSTSLNRYKRVMEYTGDPVKGVPPLLKDYKSAESDKLFKALAQAQTGQKAGSSLQVDLKEHDMEHPQVSPKGYGVFQIHHKDQWAKNPATQIESDFLSGKITAEQRQQLYWDNLAKKPGEKDAYEIAVRSVGDREFVLLPGGLHEIKTPLYFANHPKMMKPGTDKFIVVGIPDRDKVPGAKDDGKSRQWFDARFRKQFWKQYYAHEAKTISDEINNRLKSGTLTEEDAKKLIAKYKL